MSNTELKDCYRITELYRQNDVISIHYLETELNLSKSYIFYLIDEILVPNGFLMFPDKNNKIVLKATKYLEYFVESKKFEKIKKEERIRFKNAKRETFLSKTKSILVIPAFVISLISVAWNIYNYNKETESNYIEKKEITENDKIKS